MSSDSFASKFKALICLDEGEFHKDQQHIINLAYIFSVGVWLQNDRQRSDIGDYIQRLKNLTDAGQGRHHDDLALREKLQEKNKELLNLNDEYLVSISDYGEPLLTALTLLFYREHVWVWEVMHFGDQTRFDLVNTTPEISLTFQLVFNNQDSVFLTKPLAQLMFLLYWNHHWQNFIGITNKNLKLRL